LFGFKVVFVHRVSLSLFSEGTTKSLAGSKSWSRGPPNQAAARSGVKANFPGFVEPALAMKNTKPPSGERWIHEIKFDGYRAQISINNDTIRVLTRRGHDWRNEFSKIENEALRYAGKIENGFSGDDGDTFADLPICPAQLTNDHHCSFCACRKPEIRTCYRAS
jgi:ATP-dependent DNA ligase